MNNNVFALKSEKDLADPVLRSKIVNCVKENDYALLRGIFSRDDIRSKLASIYKSANDGNFYPSRVSKDVIRANVKKWSLGGANKEIANLPRFMISLYNPLFCEDIYSLHQDFNKLVYIRDTLAERELQTDDKLPAPKFNGTRLQIYPKGGGFMSAHIDYRAAESVSDLANSTYLQLVMLVTEKGTDYHSGGAYVINSKKEYIDVEAQSQSGDVVIYDGNTLHGVEDIDPDKVFSQNDIAGRAVALATIFN